MRILFGLLWLIFGAALILFAVNNRTPLLLTFDPLPLQFWASPWLILFAGLFLGAGLAGAITGWLRLQSFTRRRRAERRAKTAEAQAVQLRDVTDSQNRDQALAAIDAQQNL